MVCPFTCMNEWINLIFVMFKNKYMIIISKKKFINWINFRIKNVIIIVELFVALSPLVMNGLLSCALWDCHQNEEAYSWQKLRAPRMTSTFSTFAWGPYTLIPPKYSSDYVSIVSHNFYSLLFIKEYSIWRNFNY